MRRWLEARRSGAGGTGSGTPAGEGEAFLRERLALFALVTGCLSGGYLVGLHVIVGPWLGIACGKCLPGASHHQAHLGTILFLGVLWALARYVSLPSRALRLLDGAGMLLLAVGYVTMGRAVPAEYAGETAAVWATNMTLLARAVVLPSSALRTFVVSGLAVLVTLLGVAGSLLDRQAAPGVAPGVIQLVDLALWCGTVLGLATVASRVIYGLRKAVREARKLGQYTLLEKVSAGGMGEVYRARHAMLRRETAIKLLLPDRAGSARLARFEREVQATSELTHPNTIAIYDYGHTADGVFYYVMELLEGLDLERLVALDGAQPPGRVIHFLVQALGSLGEAHGKGLIHRDIKPANLVACERGGAADVIKVLDFGLVKDLQAVSDPLVSQADNVTGTPLYMAPEMLKAPELVEKRADLYSLGAVGYWLLTGTHVFPGSSVLEILAHHLHTEPVRPSERAPRPVPRDLEDAILACLRKDPARRPPDARTLRERLLACESAASWGEGDAAAWWRERGAALMARQAPPATLAAALTIERAARLGSQVGSA